VAAAVGTVPTPPRNNGGPDDLAPSDIEPQLSEPSDLVELDDISRRIVDECLTVRTDGTGIIDHDVLRSQLLHHCIEVRDLNGEMLTETRRYGGFD
jgi:hypothetical protein